MAILRRLLISDSLPFLGPKESDIGSIEAAGFLPRPACGERVGVRGPSRANGARCLSARAIPSQARTPAVHSVRQPLPLSVMEHLDHATSELSPADPVWKLCHPCFGLDKSRPSPARHLRGLVHGGVA